MWRNEWKVYDHHTMTRHKKIQGKNYWITMHAHDGQEGGQEDDFHYSKERQEKHVCGHAGQSMTSPVLL